MFFDHASKIKELAKNTGTSVFVVPKEFEIAITGAIFVKPEQKSVITIEQIREVISRLSLKQVSEQFILIRPADLMNVEAANAFLKNLEEPKPKIHYILVTDSPSMLLPTILSRSQIYFLRTKVDFGEIKADEKVKVLAKKLMVAKPSELISLAEEITKKKDGAREYALNIVGVSIEMLYKSYFLTNKDIFLKKLPKFLELYENLAKNGHVKLQLVSSLC